MASADAVAKIRRLMEQSSQDKATRDTAETAARRQFDIYEFNTALPSVDPSAKAKSLRGVARVVAWFAWAGPEVARFLDEQDCSNVDQLDDDQVAALAERIHNLEDCARYGLDSPDAPSAR